MFFKRLSRNRSSSSGSYVDDDYGYERSAPIDTSQPPPSSFQSPREFATPPQSASLEVKDFDKMYPRQQDGAYPPVPRPTAASNGYSQQRSKPQPPPDVYNDAPGVPPAVPSMQSSKADHSPAPDLITKAFNEAMRPYQQKIEELEQQLHELQSWTDQLEQQRADVHAWIDKRGLRPDVPPAIARQMDANNNAAEALNSQLDRKITIVNFDLHRLQDDLNDSISSAHFASAMIKFLPDVQRLAALPTGARGAFELIIKLVGNLNSHGGLDANGGGTDEEIEDDRRARLNFYDRMDNELVDVIRRRSAEGEDWPVTTEIKRLEKNAAYLKRLGIEPYFPRSLELMRQEAGGYRSSGAAQGQVQGTPPRYS